MRTTERLTAKQKKIYNTIKDRLDKDGESPTITELAKAMKAKSLRTITQYLEALERKHLITRNRYARRGIRLVEDSHPTESLVDVPVFASAGCGQPSVIAQRIFDEFITIQSSFLKCKKDDAYVIRAVGSSMAEAGISDGDMVLVEHTQDVNDNDRVVAVIDDCAVIKKYLHMDNAVVLKPVSKDPQYKTIIMHRDFPIFGKVIDVLKTVRRDDYQYLPVEE